MAMAIHKASPRRDKNFIKINCAALPKNLIERLRWMNLFL